MPTSTLISYYQQGVYYIWDSVNGFFSGAGGFTFLAAILVTFGVICLAIVVLKKFFNGMY